MTVAILFTDATAAFYRVVHQMVLGVGPVTAARSLFVQAGISGPTLDAALTWLETERPLSEKRGHHSCENSWQHGMTERGCLMRVTVTDRDGPNLRNHHFKKHLGG